VVHHNEWAAILRRTRNRLVHFDTDGGSISGGHVVEAFCHVLWDGAGDGVEVAELREVGCAGGAVGEEVWACCLEWAGCKGLGWV